MELSSSEVTSTPSHGYLDTFKEDGPILFDGINRTSAVEDVRNILIYISFTTFFVAFLIIFPGIRKEVSSSLFFFLTCIPLSFICARLSQWNYSFMHSRDIVRKGWKKKKRRKKRKSFFHTFDEIDFRREHLEVNCSSLIVLRKRERELISCTLDQCVFPVSELWIEDLKCAQTYKRNKQLTPVEGRETVNWRV